MLRGVGFYFGLLLVCGGVDELFFVGWSGGDLVDQILIGGLKIGYFLTSWLAVFAVVFFWEVRFIRVNGFGELNNLCSSGKMIILR